MTLIPLVFLDSSTVMLSDSAFSNNDNTSGEIILFYKSFLLTVQSDILITNCQFVMNKNTAVKILNQGATIHDSAFQ